MKVYSMISFCAFSIVILFLLILNILHVCRKKIYSLKTTEKKGFLLRTELSNNIHTFHRYVEYRYATFVVTKVVQQSN